MLKRNLRALRVFLKGKMENNEIIQIEPEDCMCQECSCDVCKCTKKKKCTTVFSSSIGSPMHSTGV